MNEDHNIYEDFFKKSPEMLFIAELDGRFKEVNPAIEKVIGFTPAEMLGKTPFEFLHPDDIPVTEAALKRVLAGESQISIETRCRCKDGAYKWLRLHGAPDTEKKLLHVAAADITARKMTEVALRESADTLRKIVDLAPMSMAIVGMDGTIEYVNHKAVQTFGYLHEDIPTMDRWWAQAYPDEDYRKDVVSRYMGHVREAIEKNGEIAGEEYLATCKDGTKKTCFIYGAIAAGKVFVMFDDITRRVEAEKALRESEATLRRILDNAPMAMAIHDRSGTVEYVNKKFTQSFGYALGDIPDKETWALKVAPDEVYRKELTAKWSGFLRKAVETDGEIEGSEYKIICKDGKAKTLYIFGVMAGGKAVVMFDDITQRAEAEKALRESESRYRAMVETTRTGYVIINKEGRVIDANTEYVRLTGRKDLKEVIGRSVLEWTADYEKEKNAASVAQCAREGYIRDLEVDYVGPSGQINPIEINATIIQRGGAPQIMTLCRDITRRRRTGAEIKSLNQSLEKRVQDRTIALTAANEDLKAEIAQRLKAEQARNQLQEQLLQSQKLEAVGRLAGGIAHDFNNILGSISGYAEFLLDSTPQGAPARVDLAEIMLETEKGSALTHQLLTFSEKQELKLETLDLNKVAVDSEKMLKRLVGSNMHLETRLASGLCQVKADASQISQVIMNLVINARDAMPDGGRIVLETRHAQLGAGGAKLHLSPPPGSYAELSVSDTGCGMTPEIMEHMFEPFFTTKKAGKGTGLGLATVYGIVSRAGGGISVESAPASGTKFRVYFPCSEAVQGKG